jgi:drug/metabolite transporter (DMT)-like permease
VGAPDVAIDVGNGRSTRISHRAATWQALFVTFLWSTSWVLIRWGLDGEELPPLTFAGLRYALAAVLVVAFVLLRRPPAAGRPSLDARTLSRLAVLGVLLITLAQGAQFVALAHQPAATTSLVLGLTPLFVAVVGTVALREAPSPRQLLGVLLVVVGAALFAVGDLWATGVGMLAALVGLASNGSASILGREVNRSARLSPAVVTAVSMAVGAVLLLGIGLIVEGVPTLTVEAWLLIGWLAVVNTAFAFTLWNRSLQRLSAVESASIADTMIVQVALLAWLLLGEWPGLAGLAGIVVVSIGVLLAQRRPQAEATVLT